MPVRAILFDFNGTLSDDEAIQCAIFPELFAEAGKPLSETEYYEQLAGLSNREIVETWLGEEPDDIVAERVRRFHDRVADGSTMRPAVREAVRRVAGHARLAVVSGGLRDCFEALVTNPPPRWQSRTPTPASARCPRPGSPRPTRSRSRSTPT